MVIAAEEFFDQLSPEAKARVDARAAALDQEVATLRQLRKALKLTQDEIADKLEIAQGNISKLEARNDLKVSTLAAYIAALGGDLKLVAEFPGTDPVVLAWRDDAKTVRIRKKSAKVSKNTRRLKEQQRQEGLAG